MELRRHQYRLRERGQPQLRLRQWWRREHGARQRR
ncbi:hypothetical protein PR370_03985 [Mycobacterium marinum]|nr:hypothetical protein [Mycobacterium marinum]MDC8996485.1 hypothetical protein [Mycobacterium marinum]MDC9009203.1 hypothetical protein [Mycobacterium marinum]